MNTPVQAYQLSVDSYHKMREAGILSANDRVELIRGQIVTISPKGSKHSNALRRLTSLFYRLVEPTAVISVQDPIKISDYSEPEPDLALLIPPLSRYDHRLPTSADVLLVVEVSDATLKQDRKEKALLYSEAGIAEYWIVNLQDNEIEVYQHPLDIGYKYWTRYRAGELVPVAGLEVQLAVSEMLGL